MQHCEIIQEAIQRHKDMIVCKKETSHQSPDNSDKVHVFTQLNIEISTKQCDSHRTLNDDGSYKITINQTIGTIQANTTWGALNGLITFYEMENNATRVIEDQPRFPYRGIFLNTAHNFLSPLQIKKHLDLMSYNKFNVLHWCLADKTYWSLKLKRYPALTEQRASSSDHVYNSDEIEDIIQYARLRGILIIPEFNTHSYMEILSQIHDEDLKVLREDQSKTDIYQFMKAIFDEIKQIFKNESYIHISTVEINTPFYSSNSHIRKFAEEKHRNNTSELLKHYFTKIFEILQENGINAMFGQEYLDAGFELSPESVIEIRRNSSIPTYLSKAISQSHRFVKQMNHSDPCVLEADEITQKRLIGYEWGFDEDCNDQSDDLLRSWSKASVILRKLWILPETVHTEGSQIQ
ncbi:unnamed protein product [Rotaria socialis]|uniref:beta-N-acetylhexosaminidase n=1 Tax=Rotaria socialis TaxID=392032 RepID=A0A820VQY6_9BILA|nr:unnamed protein product [Rotaria socialis]CAF4505716.1 unnamed protein product [Rotaria socialis]